jgi:hypothetical protein
MSVLRYERENKSSAKYRHLYKRKHVPTCKGIVQKYIKNKNL